MPLPSNVFDWHLGVTKFNSTVLLPSRLCPSGRSQAQPNASAFAGVSVWTGQAQLVMMLKVAELPIAPDRPATLPPICVKECRVAKTRAPM